MFKNILKKIERKKVFNGLEEETKEFVIQFLNKTTEYFLEVNRNGSLDSLNIVVFDRKTNTGFCLDIFYQYFYDLTDFYKMARDKSIDLEKYINKFKSKRYKKIRLRLINDLSNIVRLELFLKLRATLQTKILYF